MSYSSSVESSSMMPDVSRRIVLRFSIHPRLHLHEADYRELHESLVSQLLDEALAPFRRAADDKLSATYALQRPAEADLTIEGRLDTRSALTCALRAIDLFARPKQFELENGEAFNDKRLYTWMRVQTLEGVGGSTSIPFEADALAAGKAVGQSLPSYLQGATVVVRLEAESLAIDPDDFAESLEAFLENSCAFPRARVDNWLLTDGDHALVHAGDDGGDTIFHIVNYSGEGAALTVFLGTELGHSRIEQEPEED